METLNNNQQATGLQTYLNENIGVNIRVKMINGEPWFSGKDVCYSIGISKYRDFLSKLDDDERVSTNMDTLGGNQQINPEKPDVPLNKNDAFQKVQKRRVQEKR